MIKLRSIRQFYSAIYESMEKIMAESVPTMGVSTNKLYYNKDFIDKTSFEELMFINLHEIAHIALMHVARRENRDPDLWNIACDLYVNQCLLEEFRLVIGRVSSISGIVDIKPPEDGCYCTSIDTEKDYVEYIYAELEKQGKENGYFSDSGESREYKFNYRGQADRSSNTRYGSFNATDNNKHFKFEIKIQRSSGYKHGDLKDEGEDQSNKDQKSRKIISDAVVRSEMLGNMVGDGDSKIERIVKELLKSRIDWKKLLKKYLTEYLSTDSSFSKPDKRMYYQKAIYPGQVCEESDHISGIKVCIDVSGSISDDDLSRFYYQVSDILKKFKVDAELVYWDTFVQSVGSFNSYKEFKRVDCYGGGGTNPAVVFEYFKSKKESPKVILMFTDGYFYTDWDSEVNRKKYKDTIWVMTKDHNEKFNPSFGKKAIADFK